VASEAHPVEVSEDHLEVEEMADVVDLDEEAREVVDRREVVEDLEELEE